MAKKRLSKKKKEELINKFEYLVGVLAGKKIKELPSSIEYHDIYQDGYIRFLSCLPYIDETLTMGQQTAFVKQQIMGGIQDELRKLDPLSRANRTNSNKIDQAWDELRNKVKLETSINNQKQSKSNQLVSDNSKG